MTKRIPPALEDVAKALKSATAGTQEPGGGIALHSVGGPHFAPLNPKIGDTFYCAISEVAYVYQEDIGHAGWKASDKIAAHPVMVEKEERRIKDGLAKLTRSKPRTD